jgi:hypothetical protein
MLLLPFLLGLFVAGFVLVTTPPGVRHVLAGTALLVAALFATAATVARRPEPVRSGPFTMELRPPLAEWPTDVPH